MKITCHQQDLNQALLIVNHAVPGRSPTPILNNILLSTDQGRLKLVATDMEISMTCWMSAEVEREGTTTIPAKLFSDFVNSLPPTPLEISVAEDTHIMTITGLRSIATIHGTEPSEFPSSPSLEAPGTSLVLEAAVLKQIITEVTIAASGDSARPVFTGVQVEVRNALLTFVAADGHRLALRRTTLPDDQTTHDAILIPAHALKELARVLPEEGTITMILSRNKDHVFFQTENMEVTSRLIAQTFPAFGQIIPQTYTTRAVIGTKILMAMVKSVIPFAPEASHIASLTLQPDAADGLEPGTLTLRAITEGVGENVSTFQVVVDGPEQLIYFNAKYLYEYLSAVKLPVVALEMLSSARPLVLKPFDMIDYTYIIMPMSLPQ